MSTATLTTKPSTPTVRGTIDVSQPQVPLHRLVVVETRKLVDTRAGLWLVLLIVVANLLVTAALLLFAEEQGLTLYTFVSLASVPAGFLLPVLAILLVTSEWSQRTALTTFGLEPRRGRVVAAKLVTALVATAATLLVALAFGIGGTLVADATHDLADPWQLTAAGLTNLALALLLALVMGFAFAMALMSSPAAIVLYFVLPTVWTVVAATVPWARDHLQEWADINTAQSPLLSAEWLTGGEWARLGAATAIWVLAPLAFGVRRLLRSEVK